MQGMYVALWSHNVVRRSLRARLQKSNNISALVDQWCASDKPFVLHAFSRLAWETFLGCSSSTNQFWASELWGDKWEEEMTSRSKKNQDSYRTNWNRQLTTSLAVWPASTCGSICGRLQLLDVLVYLEGDHVQSVTSHSCTIQLNRLLSLSLSPSTRFSIWNWKQPIGLGVACGTVLTLCCWRLRTPSNAWQCVLLTSTLIWLDGSCCHWVPQVLSPLPSFLLPPSSPCEQSSGHAPTCERGRRTIAMCLIYTCTYW